MLLTLQVVILALMLSVVINFSLNLWVIKVVSPKLKLETEPPLVSILIPARNESANITNCLKSLQNQTYTNLEVLVLDDESQDDTALKVTSLAKEDKRIKLFNGQKLPNGWMGKNWACHQLSEQAKGEWLLFTDADTYFQPSAISASVAYATINKADLLSIFPKQIATKTTIQMIIPMAYFILYTVFPGFFLAISEKVVVYAAIGQFLMFNKKAYQEIDGHRAVYNSVIEDINLSKTIKEAGKKLVLGDGNLLVSCQMYQSFREMWKGFTKNLFACFSFSIIKLFVFIFTYLVLYIWPFVALLIYPVINVGVEFLVLVLVQLLIVYTMRVLLARRHCTTSISVLLHPISIMIVLANSFYSMYRVISGRGVEWKGRAYQR